MPNADLAEVPEAKVRTYLLSADHPTGRTKAAFFQGLGFNIEAPEELQAALLTVGLTGSVSAASETDYGWKYVVHGHITGPFGVSARVRTVWIVEAGSDRPRLVTAYPAPAEKA